MKFHSEKRVKKERQLTVVVIVQISKYIIQANITFIYQKN